MKIWRRSYDIPPPPLEKGSAFDLSNDPRYKLYGCDVPATESLKLTLERVQPYFEKEIAPRLKKGDSLMIAAHGNSLRALVKILFNVSDDDIVHVEIPTGNPLLINLDGALKPTSARYLDEARATEIPAVK